LRLAKFIGLAGVCSRRAASRLIEAGEVLVNDKVADHLTFVDDSDVVVIAKQRVTIDSDRVYVAYHKPVGIDCNFDSNDPASLLNHLSMPLKQRLFPVGRLDKDSHGLLLLTNDGECCHRLLSPTYKQRKTYIVHVSPSYTRTQAGKRTLDQHFANALEKGVMIDAQRTLPCLVTILSDSCFEIVLSQGLNRQIRKMAKTQGFVVTDLQRVAFANITLGDLGVGAQRSLSASEIDTILCLCGLAKSL